MATRADFTSRSDRRAYEMQAAVHQKKAAQIGFTDHHPGMYADRFTHKNLQTEKGRYNWLGDKYTDPNRDRPGRFKNKQFSTSAPVWYPGCNVEGNLYGLNGKRVNSLRDGDPFVSVHAPVRKEERTKVGFGNGVGKTKFVPDMSTSMRQARYTHALKREAAGQRGPTEEDMAEAIACQIEAMEQMDVASDYPEIPEDGGWGSGAAPGRPSTMGATRAVANENADPFAQFVPPHLRDRHAQTTRQERQKKAAARDGFKYGAQRPVSADTGRGAWDAVKPGATAALGEVHHKKNATKYFTDCSHVGQGLDRVPGSAPFTGNAALSYRIPKHG